MKHHLSIILIIFIILQIFSWLTACDTVTLKQPIVSYDYWKKFHNGNGFVNSPVITVNGVTTEKGFRILAGTTTSGAYMYEEDYRVIFPKWQQIFYKEIDGVPLKINGIELNEEEELIICTPQGIYINGNSIDVPQLPSSTFLGLYSHKKKINAVTTQGIINVDSLNTRKLQGDEFITSFSKSNESLYIMTPLRVYELDPENFYQNSVIECPNVVKINTLEQGFSLLAGTNFLKLYTPDGELVNIPVIPEIWSNCLAGRFSPQVFISLLKYLNRDDLLEEYIKVNNISRKQVRQIDRTFILALTPKGEKMKEESLVVFGLSKLMERYPEIHNLVMSLNDQELLGHERFRGVGDLMQPISAYRGGRTQILYDTIMKKVKTEMNWEVLIDPLENIETTHLWLGTRENGLFVFEKEWKNLSKYNSPLLSNNISNIFVQGKTFVWIGLNDANGLYRYGDYPVKWSSEFVKLADGNFIDIETNGDKVFALDENSHELYEFNYIWRNCKKRSDLSFVEYNNIALDKEGFIWAATKGNGIVQYHPDRIEETFHAFTREAGLNSMDIQNIFSLDKSSAILATYPEETIISEKTTFLIGKRFKNYAYDDYITTLPKDSLQYKKMLKEPKLYDQTDAVSNINCIFQHQDFLLFGTNKGLYSFYGNRWKSMEYNLDIPKNINTPEGEERCFAHSVNQMLDPEKNKLYIASNTGLFVSDLAKRYEINEIPLPLKNKQIEDFCVDESKLNTLWLAINEDDSTGLLVRMDIKKREFHILEYPFTIKKILMLVPNIFIASPQGFYAVRTN